MMRRSTGCGAVLCLVVLGLCLSGLAHGQPEQGNRKKLRRSDGWFKNSTLAVELPKLSLERPVLDGKLSTALGLQKISLGKFKPKKGILGKRKFADGDERPHLKRGILGGLTLPKLGKGRLGGLRGKLEKLWKSKADSDKWRFGKLGSLSLKLKKPAVVVESLKKRKGVRSLQATGDGGQQDSLLLTEKLMSRVPGLKRRKSQRRPSKTEKFFSGKFRRPFSKSHSLKQLKLGGLFENKKKKKMPKVKLGKLGGLKRFGSLKRKRFSGGIGKKMFTGGIGKKVFSGGIGKKVFSKKFKRDQAELEALNAIAQGVSSGLKVLLIDNATQETEAQEKEAPASGAATARRLREVVPAMKLEKAGMAMTTAATDAPVVAGSKITAPVGKSKKKARGSDRQKTRKQKRKSGGGEKKKKNRLTDGLTLQNAKLAQLEGKLGGRMDELDKKVKEKLALLDKMMMMQKGNAVEDKMLQKKLKRFNGKFAHKFDKLNGRLADKLERFDGRLTDKLDKADGKLIGKLNRFDGMLSQKLHKFDGKVSKKLGGKKKGAGKKGRKSSFKLDDDKLSSFNFDGLKKKFGGLKEKFAKKDNKRRGFLRKDGEKRFVRFPSFVMPAITKLNIPFTHDSKTTTVSPTPSTATVSTTAAASTTATTATATTSTMTSTPASTSAAATTTPSPITITTTTTPASTTATTTTTVNVSPSTTTTVPTEPLSTQQSGESEEAHRIAGVFHQLIGDAEDSRLHSHIRDALKMALEKLKTGSIEDAREVIVEQAATADGTVPEAGVSALDLFDSAVRAANEVAVQAR